MNRLSTALAAILLTYVPPTAASPQVWKSLPKPADFVAALKEKARLDRDFWSDEMRFARYEVEKYEGTRA